jgi:hypothetical protein
MSDQESRQTNERAVEAIRRKVLRARHHLHNLTLRQNAYVDAEPPNYKIRRAIEPDGAKHIHWLEMNSPLPVDFSIVLGDAIHNLRSALDHCVFQLSLDNTGVMFDQSMFPIFGKRVDFTKRGAQLRRIREVGDGPRALIESLQSYAKPTLPAHGSLTNLNNLGNADKHRSVNWWGLRFLPQFEVVAGARVESVNLGKILYDSAQLFWVFPETPTQEMQVRGTLQATVAIKNPAVGGQPMSFWDIYFDVQYVTELLIGALGHQADVIVAEWPTHGQAPPI